MCTRDTIRIRLKIWKLQLHNFKRNFGRKIKSIINDFRSGSRCAERILIRNWNSSPPTKKNTFRIKIWKLQPHNFKRNFEKKFLFREFRSGSRCADRILIRNWNLLPPPKKIILIKIWKLQPHNSKRNFKLNFFLRYQIRICVCRQKFDPKLKAPPPKKKRTFRIKIWKLKPRNFKSSFENTLFFFRDFRSGSMCADRILIRNWNLPPPTKKLKKVQAF